MRKRHAKKNTTDEKYKCSQRTVEGEREDKEERDERGY